jgi:hypothetical protein
MTVTLTRPTKKLTLVSVRHVYRCREYPRWRIERTHITAGEGAHGYSDRWQVWKESYAAMEHALISEHRAKAAALKAMAKAIRREQA